MIIDGTAIAGEMRAEFKEKLALIQGRSPCLAVVLVGEDPASEVYVKLKRKDCALVGIQSLAYSLPEDTEEETLLTLIQELNEDPHCDGILVQLPVPEHIDPKKVIHAISPEKDVDGFHPENMGRLLIGDPEGFVPCTPLGIQVLLERSKISVDGKHVVIIGRSTIVGKPLAALLMQRNPLANATVTVAHRATHDLASLCRSADVLVAAVGRPGLIRGDMVSEGTVVIDVGINRIEDSGQNCRCRLVGDVAFDEVRERCSAITPVPGGVGPMTRAMLLYNTLLSYQRRENLCVLS